jgi:hypothetical protein
MAGVAGFIDRSLLKEKIVISIVWIVAIAAAHVSEAQGMATGP